MSTRNMGRRRTMKKLHEAANLDVAGEPDTSGSETDGATGVQQPLVPPEHCTTTAVHTVNMKSPAQSCNDPDTDNQADNQSSSDDSDVDRASQQSRRTRPSGRQLIHESLQQLVQGTQDVLKNIADTMEENQRRNHELLDSVANSVRLMAEETLKRSRGTSEQPLPDLHPHNTSRNSSPPPLLNSGDKANVTDIKYLDVPVTVPRLQKENISSTLPDPQQEACITVPDSMAFEQSTYRSMQANNNNQAPVHVPPPTTVPFTSSQRCCRVKQPHE